MAEVSLNTEDEREDELQTQAVAPTPTIEAVPETPPQAATYQGPVDPYQEADEGQIRSLFQYRPDVLGFTREPVVSRADVPVGETLPTPVGELDPITGEQERLLGLAKSFYTLDMQERGFPEGASLERKYRILLRNEGGYLPQLDDAGNEVKDERGVLEVFSLATTREYDRYTQAQPSENIFDTAGETFRSVARPLTGPTGRGDLANLDKMLLDAGMENRIARTLALRGVATGKYSEEIIGKQLQDLKVFALSVPQMGVELSGFLTTEVIMGALDAGFGTEGKPFFEEGPEGQTLRQQRKGEFKSLSDFLDLAKHFGVETTIEKMSGDIYDPNVVEEILAPRGVYQSVAQYGAPEAALYGLWGTYKAVRAAGTIPRLGRHMKETFGTDDLVEAFQVARSQGRSHTQVVQEFIKTETNEKARRKLSQDLDVAFGMMVRRPGEARREFLQNEYNAINTQVTTTLETIRAARATGKTDVVKRQQQVLKGLRQQKVAFLHRNMVPKYYRDLYSEAGMTVGATVAFTQLSQEFFGFKQSEMMPVEIGGALSVAIPFGSFGTSADLAGAGFRALGGLYDEMANFGRAIDFQAGVIPTGFDSEGFVKGREDLKLSRQAMTVLRKVASQPSEFQTQFMQGLKSHSEYKNRLVELSARTGIEIDENLMVSNLAIMSNMAELVDISRQLDDKIAATGFDDITGPIIQQREVIAGQQDLITQLAISTQRLLDISLQGNLADDDPLKIMADQMRGFVLSQQKRLQGDRSYLNEMVEANTNALKAAMEVDFIDGDEAQEATHRLLSENFTSQIDSIMDSMSDDVQGLVLDPQQGVAERLARIETLREEQFQMINQISRGTRPEEAAMGRAGGHFANAIAYRRSLIDGEVAKMYIDFDSKHPKVHANISQQFDYFMGSDAELDIFSPDYVTEGANQLSGYKMLASDRKGFASLFNGAAKRGIEMMNVRSRGQLKKVLENLELNGAPPIKQWMELKRIARDEPELLGLNMAQAEAFVEQIPLLVNTKEWRKVNKHLTKMVRTASDERQQKYMALYDQWQLVGRDTLEGDVPNKGAFMEGWLDADSPRAVGQELYTEFRAIQDYYRREVIDRYATDKVISKWDAEMRASTKGAAVGPSEALPGGEQDELLQDFLKTFTKTDQGMMPSQWLNQLLSRVTKQTEQAGVPLSDQNLYDAVGGLLGKVGGVYDEKTGKYVILADSALPDDKYAVEVQKQLSAIITRHMQGMLFKKVNSVLPRDAKGRLVFDPNIPLDFNRDTFKSIMNIPVYTRNEAGELVPLMENGKAKTLIDEEEVYSAINLDALERNRIDLKETFDEANEYVNKIADDVVETLEMTGPRGEPIGVEAMAEEEIKFIQELQYRLFDEKASTRTYVNKMEFDERIYGLFIDRDGAKDLDDLKRALVSDGYDAKFIDDVIAKSVNDHLIVKTQTYLGNKEIVGADGIKMKRPQYGVNSAEIIKMIGPPDSASRRRLETLIGEDAVDSWELIANVINKIDPPPSGSGIDAHVSSMSLDSILSRIYNINRGVVSVQWVATESIIRASRQHSGALLRAMLKDKEVARKVLEIVETNQVPEYKVEPKWLRVLMSEVVMAEVRNENAATDTFASGFYGITGFEETQPLSLQSYMERGVSPLELEPGRGLESVRTRTQQVSPYAEQRARIAEEEARPSPVETPRPLTEIEKEFQKLGLSTKQFEAQGAQQ